MKQQETTVGIPTFLRTDKLETCLESLIPHNFHKIYIADQGKPTEEKKELYNKYREKLPLKVIDLKFDAGICKSRNKIIEKTDTNYILLLDDDHQVKNTDPLYKVMEYEKNIGMVSGLIHEPQRKHLSVRASNIQIKNNILYRDINKPIKTHITKDNIPYYIFDFIPNAVLMDMQVYSNLEWDEKYIIGSEHLDFYIQNLNEKWKPALTPSVVFNHYPGGDKNFLSNRKNNDKLINSRRYLKNKWNLEYIVNINTELIEQEKLHRYGMKKLRKKTRNSRILTKTYKSLENTGKSLFRKFIDTLR